MLQSLTRKVSQVVDDPVLRRWLMARALGRWPGPPPFTAGRPPYINGVTLPPPATPASPSVAKLAYAEIPAAEPRNPVTLSLPAETVTVAPGQEDGLMGRDFADTETLLGLHRFAWLPVVGHDVDPAWVGALWRAWARRFGTPEKGWAWHPYTAAERAINLLAFARRHGLPDPRADTIALLAEHVPVMTGGLEYFGEHNTSNHLANNGRGLFILGLELGMEASAELGARILVEEARRIFLPSGVLGEGSSHYHLLLARSYAGAWLAARAHGRAETAELEAITRRALAVIPRLVLPGGLPLVGDVSPDCPPGHLRGLMPDSDLNSGWTALLDKDARRAFGALRDSCAPVATEALLADGWLRADFGPWSGLWHAAPGGWSPMPGHGHQDLGGFELHFENEAVFRDMGRSSYGPAGDAGRAAPAHNTLIVDGADPYPPNRPYYADGFRAEIAGEAPVLSTVTEGVSLVHHGYTRLGDIGAVNRRWRFAGNAFEITDRVEGNGRHAVSRFLHTTLPVEESADGVILRGNICSYRVASKDGMSLVPTKFWPAYGESTPATTIEITSRSDLPWDSTMTVEVS
jgi:hypothetical protein